MGATYLRTGCYCLRWTKSAWSPAHVHWLRRGCRQCQPCGIRCPALTARPLPRAALSIAAQGQKRCRRPAQPSSHQQRSSADGPQDESMHLLCMAETSLLGLGVAEMGVSTRTGRLARRPTDLERECSHRGFGWHARNAARPASSALPPVNSNPHPPLRVGSARHKRAGRSGLPHAASPGLQHNAQPSLRARM